MAVNFGVARRNHGAILVEAEGQGEERREGNGSSLDGRHFGKFNDGVRVKKERELCQERGLVIYYEGKAKSSQEFVLQKRALLKVYHITYTKKNSIKICECTRLLALTQT